MFTDSGHFSINGTKISSHHLFIGVLFSVRCGGLLPPQQYCLLPEDTSGFQKYILEKLTSQEFSSYLLFEVLGSDSVTFS